MKSSQEPARPSAAAGAGEARAGGHAWAVAACALTTGLALPLRGSLVPANLILLYLLAVVFVTVRFGRAPGVLASVLAVLAFDIFLVPPYLSLSVADPQYLLTFAMMLVVSLIISHLTASLRYQARIALQREARAHALFDLSRELSGALSNAEISDIGVRRLDATFQARTHILFPDEQGRLAPAAAAAPRLADTMMVIARTVYEREVVTGYEEGAALSAGVRYLPLRAPMRTRGVLVLAPADSAQDLTPEQERLLQTCAAQIALAIERVHYVDVARGAMLAIESERLRNSLLSAISHDIRTPLTTIVGLSSTLAEGRALPPETGRELILAVHDAALRMHTLVTNLLDMARLQAGAVKLNRQWQMLEEAVGGALAECAVTLAGHGVRVALPATLPLVEFDAVLLQRVLCNLLDNASKHGAPGGPISIAARLDGGSVAVTVEDSGPGVASGMEQAIFAMFARGEAEPARAGAGLGLAICKAIVEAHGGAIRAENRAEGGARFEFTLPLGVPPSGEEIE